MKRKLFLGLGAALLTAVGVFAVKANKFAVSHLYYWNGSCNSASVTFSAAGAFVTGLGSSTQATIITSGNHSVSLYATSGCGTNAKVFFQPI